MTTAEPITAADWVEALTNVDKPFLAAVGTWDEPMKSYVIHRTGPWIVSVSPMLFNSRVLLTHVAEYPLSWTAGFCYDKGPAAPLAAAAWDPLATPRPVGFKKVAGEDLQHWATANRDWRRDVA